MKDSYYITVKSGLVNDPKHFRNMLVSKKTTALWMYTWFLDKMTRIDKETGLGFVLGGKPLKLDEIQPELKQDIKTKRRIFHVLIKHKYIEVIRTPYGHIVYITKAFKVFGQKAKKGDGLWKKSFKSDLSQSGRSESQSGRSSTHNLVGLSPQSGRSNKDNTVDNTVDILPAHQNSQDINKPKALSTLKEKKDKEHLPPNSGDPPFPKKYSEKVYPNEDYEKILKAYCAVKGVEPKGGEWNLLKREIKQMFVNGRRVEEILYAIKALASQNKFSWTLKTVRFRMPELLASGGKK